MKKGGGFSLLELIICLAIFSILMAISAPNFFTMRKNAQQKDAARSIMLALRHARTQAVTENIEYQVAFDLDTQRYWLERGNLADKSTAWEVVRHFEQHQGGIIMRALANCTSGSGQRRIQFNPNGTSNTLYICAIDPDSIVRFRAGTSVAKIGRPVIHRDATGGGYWK